MKNLRLLAVSGMVVMALLFGFKSNSQAISLYLNDLSTNTDVTVNGVGGAVFYNAPLGNWSINVTTGITKPILGSALFPDMDLNSVNVTSSGPASLLIKLTEQNFSLANLGGSAQFVNFKMEAGGTSNGNVTFQGWADDWNDPFFQWKNLFGGTLGPYGPGAFSFTVNGGSILDPNAPGGGLYSLTIIAQIIHTGASQVTSFDAELTGGKIPEPISLILLGSGLAGAGLYRRLRKPKG